MIYNDEKKTSVSVKHTTILIYARLLGREIDEIVELKTIIEHEIKAAKMNTGLDF